MKLDTYAEVKRLTSEMVAIPSINKEPKGETAVAEYVYDYYMGLDYFKKHPAGSGSAPGYARPRASSSSGPE